MPIYRIGTTKVLFIHIPKTAGMALDAHLSAQGTAIFNERIFTQGGTFGPRHQPADVLQRIFLPEMIDYAFTVVRHPVARMISEYRYQRRKPGLHLSRLRFAGFDAWLKYSLWRAGRERNWRGGHFRPQVDYDCFDCEAFHYEDGLEKVMEGVSRATGRDIPFNTPPRNVSTHRDVSVSRQSIELIARFYAEDFARFGYSLQMPALPGVTVGG